MSKYDGDWIYDDQSGDQQVGSEAGSSDHLLPRVVAEICSSICCWSGRISS